MAILYDDEKRIFTLHTKNSTYQFQADIHGYLMHLYYGRRSEGLMNWMLSFCNRGFACSPYDAGNDRTYSLDYLPQEFPFQGSGDFRSPMLIVRDCNGTYDCDLRYKGYEIVNGKYSLSGLPASYSDNDDDQTLKIFLEDSRLNIRITLLYGILYENDIITRSAVLRNNGHKDITIEKFQSSCLDFTHGHFDIITFHGRHTLEMQPERHELNHVSHVIGSRRGTSSHQYNPFGRCWGMQFVWSGEFKAEAELDQYNQTRIQMGLHEEKFSYPVRPDEEFTAPEVIMSFSSEGLNHLSQNFHKCIRNNICRGFWKNKPRPVLLNSWEASYFNFTGESLLSMARHAKDLNIDMFVLDDGWFINRSNDDRALGDWIPDEIGAICWMLCDNPGQSPRIPIFSGSTSLPEGFDKCGQLRYRDEAWIWHYRKANKLATVQWGRTKSTLLGTANRFEQKAFDEIPAVEERAKALLAEGKKKEATETLNQYTSDFAASTRQAWKEMENKFWYWFGFGF